MMTMIDDDDDDGGGGGVGGDGDDLIYCLFLFHQRERKKIQVATSRTNRS